MIADASRPIGIAGVMGGANTEVGDETTSILLEAANFEPLTVLRSGERHRMRTESQTRWEKGVDPELAGPAATLRVAAARRARGRALDRRDGRARRAAAAGRDPVQARRARPRCSGFEIPEGEQRERLAAARLHRRRRLAGRVSRPGARATCAARSTSSRRSRASGSQDVPLTLPTRQEMFGRLTHEQRLRAPGRGRARRRRLLRGVHLLAAARGSRPGGARAAGAAQLAAAAAADDARRSACAPPRA